MNYCKIPKDCRSNSFIENYNLYLKNKLGKKKTLTWIKFITFLKKESLRVRSKLTKNTDININYHVKRTKFGKDKYNNKFDYKNINNFGTINSNINKHNSIEPKYVKKTFTIRYNH